MKKGVILLTVICLMGSFVAAQNANCPGLKNPTNFTLTGGTVNSLWIGKTGTKQGTASTCTTLGSSLTTTVQASSLTTVSSGSSCYGNTSTDINGNNDYMNQFVIKGSGSDVLTGNNVSYLPPDSSFTSSIRLGNSCGGTGAEQLTYEFTVNANNALVTIWYAMSLYNALHDAANNPEFVITVMKQDYNGNWSLAAGDTLCYIQPSPTSSAALAPFSSYGSDNVYLNWRKVLINLFKLIDSRVRIVISTGDCAYSAHYGYCYFAGECQPMKLSANGCAAGETSSVARISAPTGATAYKWFRSKTGALSTGDLSDTSKYVVIDGATDSVLECTTAQFVNTVTGETLLQNSFRCQMTTKMNQSLPVIANIFTSVANTKPTLVVDSVFGCDGDITLIDKSFTPFITGNDSDLVDTNLTRWYWYSSATPNNATLVDSSFGGTAYHQYPSGGNYSVVVRTYAVDTSCWNQKQIKIRTIKRPKALYNISANDLCAGDTIVLMDLTPGSTYHHWTIGDTVFDSPTSATKFTFYETSTVNLSSRGSQYFQADTTGDGLVEDVYCYNDTSFVIYVEKYPTLHVSGDTIVCNGDQSDVHVTSDVANCTYNWYHVLGGTTPVVENNDELVTNITEDRRYYVKVTSPFGCTTWDSIDLYLVLPSLEVSRDRICTGDSVTLIAGRAAYFEWSSSPDDPALAGQSLNDTIVVSPDVTTTYSVIGHGTNGCGATALTQKITVFPYPILKVVLTPDYIDSENPSVQFSDQSEYGTTSLWNFGNGNTSSTRTVVFTFTDLSQDSIEVSLVTGNALGCSVDTSFFVPVGIFAVWFPNAFTPGLETNNTFQAFTANDLTDYELYIYDRQGILVFSGFTPEMSWNGTYKGHDCPPGTYVYIAKYRRAGVDRLMSQKGTVTLLR